MAGNCLLDDQDYLLFRFSDKNTQAVVEGKKPNVTFRVDITDGGLSTVYFANCENSMPVSFDVRVESYNLVGPEGRKDYLSIGESELDVMYWVSRGPTVQKARNQQALQAAAMQGAAACSRNSGSVPAAVGRSRMGVHIQHLQKAFAGIPVLLSRRVSIATASHKVTAWQ